MNSIRTPKQGVTDSSRRIARAVDDESWQEFRLNMKGKSTKVKLEMLKEYYEGSLHKRNHTTWLGLSSKPIDVDCDICIRVDNYVKALCRGGQLKAGESLETMIRKGLTK